MDLSKLPKLSNSPAPPPESAPPGSGDPTPPHRTEKPRQYEPASYGAAELWISVGLGLFLLFLNQNTVKYAYGKLTGTVPGIYLDPTPGVAPGTKCDYFNWLDSAGMVARHEMYRDTITFWSDLAVTSFALVLILDGIVMAISRRPGVIAALLGFTVLAILGNLFYLIKTLDQGLAIMSAAAVIIGGYVAMLQWARFKLLSAVRSGRA